MSFTNDYKAFCAESGTPDRVELLLCDLNAVLRGKWLPGDGADKLEKGAVRLPLSTYAPAIMGNEVAETGLGIEVGDPDGVLVPIEGTLKPAPWLRGNVAQVLVEMTDKSGAISTNSPRALLQRMLTRFKDHGWRPVVATELEFYILRARSERAEAPTPPSFSPDAQNYDMELLAKREVILNDIMAASIAQGLATDTLIAEYGQGQFEINFHHTDDALAAAETAILFRRLVRGIVDSHGYEATFMAKPYADQPGNGMHVHASVIDRDGQNIFSPAKDGDIAQNLRNAVAGVIDSMRDLQAIFAPHANSYRRFKPNSFAPATPDWGLDNRAASVRLPEIKGPGARLEHRISGADTNPYLVLTAILGGMLHGLTTAPSLSLPLDDPECVPAAPLGHDWSLAVERFSGSDVAADCFGDYREVYSAVKRDEIATILDPISPAEYTYYLSRM
ncbi:Gamma-glutamylputrescine synthetase PuuA [Ruegeria denitrificans]|uniref:Gamma-glutamylputrescine synthetase PuuA n=1 Tax=Ruegeria denitrificans TaxID=1715692 RepID=A0A0P1IK65_9RHOB|nr:glutamine synthetase family protein [Ruegeria denitrificans]CUK18297.1 Gamma-glutamylputrescine synthetase PuuA [Ruegeria denitrificans]